MLCRSSFLKPFIVGFSRSLACDIKTFSSDPENRDAKYLNSPKSKYKIFQDEDSPIVLDVGEEKRIHRERPEKQVTYVKEDVCYKRGITGVFDVDELVETLQKDNARDIFVVKVSKELHYVDYLVISTGRSKRHLLGLSEYVRSIYKKKMHSSDVIPKIEGENSSEWLALDLGNIALHIMSAEARERYDLESLWSIGAKYDVLTNNEDNSLVQLLKKHSVLLDDIQPLQRG